MLLGRIVIDCLAIVGGLTLVYYLIDAMLFLSMVAKNKISTKKNSSLEPEDSKYFNNFKEVKEFVQAREEQLAIQPNKLVDHPKINVKRERSKVLN